MSARLARSSSSQSWAETYGDSSESRLTGEYSVQTAAQPPSALTPRCSAWEPGLRVPKPVQCGTW